MRLALISGAGALYMIEWNGGRAALKLFVDDEGPKPPGERAKDRAAAEAAGLRIYSPKGLAPELIWEGASPAEISCYGVIYHWVEGASLCGHIPSDLGIIGIRDQGSVVSSDPRSLIPDPSSEIELYAGALWAVHSEQPELKILSPNPRNLEVWWGRTHEQYRDLQADLQQSLPESLSNELGRLTQSVAADAQAHKRFWHGVALVPVQGNPTCDNLIAQGERATFIDWQRFGLGDTAYELALAASPLYWSETEAQSITANYLERANDPRLSVRIQLYNRLLPLSRALTLLASNSLRTESWGGDLLRNLKACIETYSRPDSTPMSIYNDAEEWVSSLHLRQSAHEE